ncbi:MAG TPA: NB-ARC domain-containing protein, partial [Streptomyces sp.]
MADNNEFGAILRAERENRKLGLREFAATIHYSPGHVSKVELGHVDPSPEFVKACDLALLPDPPLVERARFTPRQAARFTSARPAQLPDPGAELVGRGAALDTLARQAETAPTSGDGLTIVLHGPPGIGKTALALRWARDHAYRYPDGNLLADLHGYSQEGPRRAGDVIEDWLRAFGVSADRLPESADDRAALLRSVVAGKRLLIVLDNVSAAAQIAPLLPAGSGTAVLVLSRSDLPGSLPEAARVELGGLAPEHALRMLRGIVGAARADAEPAAAADLARDYAPLPLALRLLGEYMAARPDADLTDLAAEAARALPRQQETLREAFAWSYSRLSEPASTLFRMLGLHAGTEFGLAAAAAMLGRAVDETAPLLVELVAARLLQPLPETEARYRFHDLLRGFAADLADATLPEDVRTRTVNRALSFYLHTAAAAAAVLAPAGTRPAVPALPPPAPRVTPQTFAAD